MAKVCKRMPEVPSTVGSNLTDTGERPLRMTRQRLVDHLIRADVRAMGAYHVPDASGFVKLDAMENPYPLPDVVRAALAQRLSDIALNRYPVAGSHALRARLKAVMRVPDDADVLLGNGSDEIISMLSLAMAQPGAVVLAPVPGFVMYEMSARLAGLGFVGVPLREDFTLDLPAMLAAMRTHQPAIIYLPYPNNPTGTLFDRTEMEAIIRAAQGDVCHSLVVVDEAYQPFAQDTWMPQVMAHDNLLVLRTVSKLGLAGIRLGYVVGSPEWLCQLDKVRPPYNINVLTETAALVVLEHLEALDTQAAVLRDARATLIASLVAMPGVAVFPSAANFLLVRVPDSAKTEAGLLARKVLVKNVGKMHPLLTNCLRVTVSTPEENAQFLDALSASLQELSCE